VAWYWWVIIAIAVFVLLSRLRNKGAPTRGDAPDFNMMVVGSPPSTKPLPAELKPYVTSLCRVHKTVGSFASPETPKIGQQIHEKHGHEAMVAVCDEVRKVLGGGPARDLEYKWNGIGEWMG
jgi:hypothetical protein